MDSFISSLVYRIHIPICIAVLLLCATGDSFNSWKGSERYYCIGKVEVGIMPVRFTYRKNKIRIIGAGYWRKGKDIYYEERL